MELSQTNAATGRPRLALPLSPDFNPWEDSLLVDMILYIGNLSLETTYQELYYYLLGFDEVVWMKIQFDKSTATPKGYAHAILRTSLGYHRILTSALHLLRGCKLRIKMGRKSTCFTKVEGEVNKRKVFVKRLPKNMTSDRLRVYFSTFGTVVDVDIPVNHVDKTSRRIGFVTFESEEIAIKCAEIKKHRIKGAEIICKRYVRPEDKAAASAAQIGDEYPLSGDALQSGSTAPLEKVSEVWGKAEDRGGLTKVDIETRYPSIDPKHLFFLQKHFPFHNAGQHQSTFIFPPVPDLRPPVQQTFPRPPISSVASLNPRETLSSRAVGARLLSHRALPSEQLFYLSQGSLTSAGLKALQACGDGITNPAEERSSKKKVVRCTGSAIVFFKEFGLKIVHHNTQAKI